MERLRTDAVRLQFFWTDILLYLLSTKIQGKRDYAFKEQRHYKYKSTTFPASSKWRRHRSADAFFLKSTSCRRHMVAESMAPRLHPLFPTPPLPHFASNKRLIKPSASRRFTSAPPSLWLVSGSKVTGQSLWEKREAFWWARHFFTLNMPH